MSRPSSDVATHGTTGTYQKGCRCQLCKTAQTDYCREYRRRRALLGFADREHGTVATWSLGCRCDECRGAKRIYDKAHRAKNPELHRRKSRKHLYGMTHEQYEAFLTLQDGACAVCRGSGHRLAVDHDHACCPQTPTCGGCNRGLVCNKCNLLLGHANDDVVRLQAAVNYLSATR